MNKKRWRKILKGFIILLLAASIFVAVGLVKQRQEIRKEAAGDYVASLSLSPTEVSVQPGESFSVDVILNTGGADAVGVDTILKFDSNKLEVLNVVPNLSTNFETFAPVKGDGSFDNAKVVSQANSNGELEFGAVTFNWGEEKKTDSVTGVVNPLATVTFRAKTDWTLNGDSALISFGFDSLGETTDSNVVEVSDEGVADILKDPSANTAAVTLSSGGTTVSTPTPTLVPTITTAPTPTPTLVPTATSTPAPNKGSLTFKIKFQGVDQARLDKMVKLILKKSGQIAAAFDNINVSSDQDGVYTGTVMNIDPGTYDVYIKGWVHLQKKVGQVTIEAGGNSEDWSGSVLLAGDAVQDDKINIQDFRILVEDYLKSESPADFNLDGKVNIQDFRFVAENYLKEGEE